MSRTPTTHGSTAIAPLSTAGIAAAPPNDNFASAAVLPESTWVTGTTVGATLEPGEPRPCGSIGATVWFRLTPSASGVITISMRSDFNSVLALYTGTSLPTLSQQSCNAGGDNLNLSNDAMLMAEVVAGQTYYVQLGGVNGVSGNYQLTEGISFPKTVMHGRVVKGGAPVVGLMPFANCSPLVRPWCEFELSGPTRSDGTYTLFGWDDARYELYAGNFGSGVNSLTTVLADTSTVNAPDIVVFNASGALVGTVSSTAGGSVSGASVNLGIQSRLFDSVLTVSSATSDGTGGYSAAAAPASYDLQVYLFGYRYYHQTGSVSVPGTQNIALQPFARMISGRVLVGGSVVANTYPSAQCVNDDGSGCGWDLQSYADGSYALWGDPGQYDIYDGLWQTASFNSVVPTYVDARNPGTFTGSDIQVQQSTGVLSGRATSSTGGAALSGAWISLGIPSAARPGTDLWLGGNTTGPTGSYYIEAAPSTYSAGVYASGYHDYTQPNPPGVSVPGTQNFTLAPFTVTITGRLLNDTTPVARKWPYALPYGANCGWQTPYSSDATGSFTVFADPCMYELYLGLQQQDFNSTPSTGTTVVDATAGGSFSGRDIQVRPSTSVLNGTVTSSVDASPLSGALVSLGIPSAASPGTTVWLGSVTAATNGSYSFNAAADPAYCAGASAAGYQDYTGCGVVVPGADDFQLAPATPGSGKQPRSSVNIPRPRVPNGTVP